MKKIVYFLPVMLSILFFGLVMLIGLAIGLIHLIWLVLYLVSGILLARGRFWGAAFGMLPGFHMMYMSTVDTGQVLPIELPLGIVVVVFYLLCGGWLLYQKQKAVK